MFVSSLCCVGHECECQVGGQQKCTVVVPAFSGKPFKHSGGESSPNKANNVFLKRETIIGGLNCVFLKALQCFVDFTCSTNHRQMPFVTGRQRTKLATESTALLPESKPRHIFPDAGIHLPMQLANYFTTYVSTLMDDTTSLNVKQKQPVG